jgi:hypothetical protein
MYHLPYQTVILFCIYESCTILGVNGINQLIYEMVKRVPFEVRTEFLNII